MLMNPIRRNCALLGALFLVSSAHANSEKRAEIVAKLSAAKEQSIQFSIKRSIPPLPDVESFPWQNAFFSVSDYCTWNDQRDTAHRAVVQGEKYRVDSVVTFTDSWDLGDGSIDLILWLKEVKTGRGVTLSCAVPNSLFASAPSRLERQLKELFAGLM